jgi:hypothetical protein
MEYNLDTILNIDGNGMHDAEIASKFINECLHEVGYRLARLKQIDNLSVILDDDAFAQARSDFAGIKQIYIAMRRITNYHLHSNLSQAFKNASKQIDDYAKNADSIFDSIKEIYPS